jgi:nitroreductase
MEEQGAVQFPWRTQRTELERLRRLAKAERRSMNAVLGQAFREYEARRMQARKRRRKMRWVINNVEYDTQTATVLAHAGRDPYTGRRQDELLRTPDGDYFMVAEEEGEGYYVRTLYEQEAYDTYLSLPFHLVDEDEAFDLEQDEADEEEEAPVS